MSASSSCDNGGTHIDADLYKAATNGNFELCENYAQSLDHLLIGKNKNTLLHLHLNSPCQRSKGYVKKVLSKCPHLLWQTNNDGDTPLHIAANYGHREIVEVLIAEAKEPIHRDLETGEEEAARRMLRLRNKQHETALHLAARGKFLGVVKEILEHEDPKYTYTANKCGESPLYLAVNRANDSIAIEILNKFESPDCSGPKGTTVFHAVVFHYYSNQWLLDLLWSKVGSFVNQTDESGWTPLHYVAYLGYTSAVRKILENDKRSAYLTDKERNRTALHMTSCRGVVDIMKEIIDKCPECCEITDVRGWNVLHYAVISRNIEAVKIIMKDSSLVYLINGRDIKGYSPLHLLLPSNDASALLSWLRSDESVVHSRFILDKWNSIGGVDEEEILEWVKDLGKNPFEKKIEVRQSWEEIENAIEEKVIPELEKAKDSHLVAAALVATVTFAAAFTLPGGYISDENDSKLKGTPILSRNAAFKAFVVTDAMAMVLSTSSVFIHFVMVLLGYKLRYYWLIRSAFWFIVVAMGAMVVAFVTGTYAVLAPNLMELAISTCVIGLTFFVLVLYVSIRLIYDFIKHERSRNRESSITQSLGLLLDFAQYLFVRLFLRDV